MVYIYVLKLQQNKYYIGKTNNPSFRIDSHFQSDGSAWTKIYKPIEFELIPNCDEYDENKYTQIYMSQYGIDNVRGGSFVQVELCEKDKETLQKMINGSSDKCFKCGQAGHFAKDCFVKTTYHRKTFTSYIEEEDDEDDKCFRCGRTGHYASSCYAKYYVNDESDESDENEEDDKCFRCGRTGHYASSCYAKYHIGTGYKLKANK